VTLTVSSGPPAQVPSGLVLSLNLDTVTGGIVTDASGNNYNGTVRGALPVAGKRGGALQFDGVDDWVTITDTTGSALDLTTGMTLVAWVNPTTLAGWDTIILKERGAGNLSYGLYAHDGGNVAGGQAVPAAYIRQVPVASTANMAVRGNSALPVGVWTHAAVTYEAGVMRLFLNGEQVAEQVTATAGNLVQGNGALRIGGNAAWAGEFFRGLIDEVHVYNRALSELEIEGDMNAAGGAPPVPPPPPPPPPPPSTSGLVLALGFDEAVGSVSVTDASSGNRHGSIAGAQVVAGKYGNALSFDGVNDMVTVQGDQALALASAMTLEAWVRPTDVTGWRTVMLMENAPTASYYLYANDPNLNRPAAYYESGANVRLINGTTTLPANAWTHLAVTYDGANMRLYVNGELVRTVARAGAINSGIGPLRIGGNTVWPNEFFRGLIDEVRIYNRALSADEVVGDMARPVTSPTP
jgi:hypothetical protein